MKFSIVVPHYTEKFEIVKPLLDSISIQQDIDLKEVEVIIVNDGNKNEINVGDIPEYPFSIKVVTQEHRGVSAARNLGLDVATGTYVMFCDSDDLFCSMFSLQIYDKAMNESPYDIIRGSFIEDQFIEGEWKLIRHDNDISFVHGKMYRRQFLIDNRIRFDDTLTIHEDGYFTALANMVAQGNIRETQVATYLWKYRDDSIVRKDTDMFVFKTYGNLMDCRIALCRELLRREMYAEYFQTISKTVLDSYYDFQKPECLNKKNKELIAEAKEHFARFYKEFGDEYKKIGIQDIATMMYLCRDNAFKNGMRVEQQTVTEFLNEIVMLES